MKCKNCGSEVREDVQVCPVCGASIDQIEVSSALEKADGSNTDGTSDPVMEENVCETQSMTVVADEKKDPVEKKSKKRHALRTLGIVILVLIISIAVAAAVAVEAAKDLQKKTRQSLIGSWEGHLEDGTYLNIEFDSDGTGSVNALLRNLELYSFSWFSLPLAFDYDNWGKVKDFDEVLHSAEIAVEADSGESLSNVWIATIPSDSSNMMQLTLNDGTAVTLQKE